MGKRWISLGLSVLITLSITPFAVSPAFAADSAGGVVNQINAIRIQNGLAPLIEVPQLSASAQSYASAMATGKFFAHAGPDGSTFSSRDEAAGYTNWTYLEENLAAGQPTVAAAVNAWMKSPAHRADLLSPRVTETGVGYVDLTGSPYGHYWVQEFGSRSTAPAPVVVAPIPVVSAAPTAPVVLAAVKTPPASTPVTIAAPPVTIAPITVTSAPRTVIARTQRDPDNLNLYLNLYRDLGFN